MDQRIAPAQAPRFLACVRNDGYELDLVVGKRYEVFPDASAARSGWIRVVDETGEDYLYPAGYFAVERHRGAPPRTGG
jgi:hypothetical protein